jgi:hypothetical protein
LLLEAYDRAREDYLPARENALNWNFLHSEGLTRDELDALRAGGHLEHLEETTRRRNKQRTFREAAGAEPGPMSRVVLTARGAGHIRQVLAIAEAEPGALLREALAWVAERPLWDDQNLWWHGAIVKSLRDDGASQQAALTALEAVCWREPVRNPLPARTGRNRKRMLYDTIESLNDRQTPPSIRFYAVGGCVFWRPVHMNKLI